MMSTPNYPAYAVWSVVASSIIFAAVIVWIFQKFLTPAVAAAQKTRNEEIAAMERKRDKALADLDDARFQQRKLEEALAEMRLRAQSDAQREREHIVQDARDDGERLVRNADGELDRVRAAGQAELRKSLITKAIHRTRERAMHEVNSEVDSRLVMNFAHALESKNSFAVAGESNHA
jgi:F0F1-type ATP synthase membrane subunit b/b'